jgi:dihydroorotate dehydrogenase (fumarate)
MPDTATKSKPDVGVDLRTTYLGLELRSPLVAGASPLNRHAGTARRLEAAGVAAIVLPSLFEEEIVAEEVELDRALEQGTHHFAEALDYFPSMETIAGVGDRYVADLERVKRTVGIPVIASLNAASPGGWVRYATRLAEAGADALELNLYHVAADPATTADDVEARDLEVVDAICAAIRIPVAVKLSPYYSAFAGFAARVVEHGAEGLVLFNRFYQPDLDLDTFDVVPRVDLSGPPEVRLPLRWIAILRPQLDPVVSIAATSGIHDAAEVVKAIAVGADVAMMTTALLERGPEHVRNVESDLRAWLTEREYASIAELRGSATRKTVADPSAYERANYMRTLRSWATPPPFEPAARHGRAVTATQQPGGARNR